jgi:phosphatidylglycerophosphatase A
LWASLVATSLGAGLVPVAPGHSGTLMALLLVLGLDSVGAWAFGLGLFVVTALGTVAAEIWCTATGVDDDQRIVVDEVAGYMLTVVLVRRTLVALVVGFVVFRVLDVWKPGPVRRVDERVGGGLGVMADDLVAGLIGAVVMLGLQLSGALAALATLLGRLHGLLVASG